MNIKFLNNCDYIVVVTVKSGEPVEIQPHCTVSISCPNVEKLNVRIKRNIASQVKKGNYFLALETEYVFADITDGEIFAINREKVRVNLNIYYDRLFLTAEKALYISESHNIIDSERIKKSFKKSRLADFLFDTFMCSIGLFLILLIIGAFLSYIFGWQFAVIYFPSVCIFLLAFNWFVEYVWKLILNKGLKKDDDKKEFYNCFENDFIISYYSDPNRTPFMDEIETN